jgi:zinc transporter ZupT
MAVTKGAVARVTGGRLAAWGGASLGFVMGTLGWYFVRRFGADQFTATSLSVTIGVLLGGVVAAYLDRAAADDKGRWWYPIGLLLATFAYPFMSGFLGAPQR